MVVYAVTKVLAAVMISQRRGATSGGLAPLPLRPVRGSGNNETNWSGGSGGATAQMERNPEELGTAPTLAGVTLISERSPGQTVGRHRYYFLLTNKLDKF
jgi:hypothetical protein